MECRWSPTRCETLSGLCIVDCAPSPADERPGLGTVDYDMGSPDECGPGFVPMYGIRPHMPMTPLEARQVSITYEMTEINRPATELLFDLCLKCTERRRNCTCHERGIN